VNISWSKAHYHLFDGRVRWQGHDVTGADPATFSPLNHIWARDANHIYTQNSVNRLADLETFEVLNHLYARDKNHAFYLSGIIQEADAATFRVLDSGRHIREGWTRKPENEDDDLGFDYEGFACDATQVFHYVLTIGKPCVLRGADPATFKVLPNSYGRDAKSVYYEKYRLKGAKPQTFRQLNQHFAADERGVFYADRTMDDADAASFKILGEYWAKDAKRVYFQDKIVEADPATIELVAGHFARDGQRVYGFLGQVVEAADPATFQPVGDSYFKDRTQVYYSGYPVSKVEGADPGTFQVVTEGKSDARDARSLFRDGKRLGPGPNGQNRVLNFFNAIRGRRT